MMEAPKSKEALISGAGVCVALKSRPVVRGVSLDLFAGEMVCLVGPNGAGKTSLLRTMLGLLPSSEGSVLLEGKDIEALSPPERARHVSYMAQGSPVFWPLEVQTVVELGRIPHHNAWNRLNDVDRLAVDKAMEKTNTHAFKGRLITQLSGGEKARVMLARTLANEAKCLFADEPVASLDPRYQLEIMDVLLSESRAGKAVVVVMHDLALAARYADRVLVMDEGVLIADGASNDVLTDALLRDTFGVDAIRDAAKPDVLLGLKSLASSEQAG